MEPEPGDIPSPYGAVVTGELLPAGERLGGFEIAERLAVTLLGALYRVHVRPVGGTRLIQIMPRALTRDPRLHDRLRKRVGTLSTLESDLVLVPEAVEVVDDRVVVVYPDHNSIPLPQVRRETPNKVPQSFSEIRSFLKSVVLALDVASQVGAHHFALTPDYLLLSRNGSLKVWGFGIMELLDRRQFEIFISSAIIPLQRDADNPDFTVIEALSPEWRNEDALDVRGDLFGVGVLAFSLLTGQRLAQENTRPSELRPEVPAGWDYCVRRLLESDPGSRYQTLAAVSTDLDRIERLGPNGLVAPKKKGPFGLPARPGGKEMSPRARKLVAVGSIAIVLLLFVGAGFFVSDILFGSDAAPDFVRVDASTGPANLILSLSPETTEVALSGDGMGQFQVSDGRLALVGEPGNYRVTVRAKGFQPETLSISLAETPVERMVELLPASGSLRLASIPEARLDVRQPDGTLRYLGTVPESGVLEVPDRLLARAHTLVVSHPRYESLVLSEVELTADEWVEINAKLVPKRVPVTVRSSPLGVPVSVNGIEVGETPVQIADVPVDQPVEIRVGSVRWRAWETSFLPDPDGDNVVSTGLLEPTAGRLRLNLDFGGRPARSEELAELTVTLGEHAFTGSTARAPAPMPAGEYALRIAHPDYFAKTGTVVLRDRETVEVSVDLRPRPATLEIILPAEQTVRVLIDGKAATWSGERGRLTLPPGQEIAIALEAPDFLDEKTTVHLGANATERWEPDWRRIPGPTPGEFWSLPRLPAKFAWVPAGVFEMGSPLREPMRRPNEGPVNLVRLSRGFWVGTTEITQDLYTSLMEDNPSQFSGGHRPVDSVSWQDAQAFCERLTARERRAGRLPSGYIYRLPTEAEWAYSARARTDTPFSFGATASGDEGQFLGRYPRDYDQPDSTHSPDGTALVAQYPPNPWGLYDVHGNVAEWTLDAYRERLPGTPQNDPHFAQPGRGIAVRGGSWSDLADRCRSAARDHLDPVLRRPFVGFRVVLAPAI